VKQEKLRVGVIGVGHHGEYHVQKYKALPTVELVGVVDTNPDRAHEIAQRFNTTAYSEHNEIMNMVDGVSLAVPTGDHFDVAKDILSRGVHLLIEKPITYNLEHAEALIHMAREKGLVLQVGLVERFNPAVVEMMSLLHEPVLIESQRMNQFTTRGTDVDVVIDLMIHDLDIILHIVQSEVKEIHAMGMPIVTGKTDIANVRMIFENGTVANLTASRLSHRALREMRVFQPDACFTVDYFRRELSVTRLDHDVKNSNNFPQISTDTMTFPGRDSLADEISSFVNAITNGSEPIVTGHDGRKALKISLGIIDQIKSGSRDFQAI
jgi:predicted dehydrogenase